MEGFRRCGAHEVWLANGEVLRQAVVEIEEGRVVNYYEFHDELPLTEWLGGTVRVDRDEEGFLRAYYMGKLLE